GAASLPESPGSLRPGSLTLGSLSPSLLKAVSDTSFGEVIRRHLDQNLVAGKDSDPVFAHASRGVGDNFVFVLELHPEGGIREELGHYPRKFEHFFFRHKASLAAFQIAAENGRVSGQNQGGIGDILLRFGPADGGSGGTLCGCGRRRG